MRAAARPSSRVAWNWKRHWQHRWRLGAAELLFVAGWCTVLVLCRIYDLPQALGQWIVGGMA